MREVSSLGGFGQFVRTSTCNVCRGRGSIVNDPCEDCRGTGRVRGARTVTVEAHEHFVRDGDDLIYRLDVTMVEAALGTTAYVPAFDGDIEVELRPGTQPGEAKIYRNRGVPALQGYGRGDLKVVVNVQVPRHLSAEQREVLEQFAELTGDANYEPDQSFLDKVRAVFRQ